MLCSTSYNCNVSLEFNFIPCFLNFHNFRQKGFWLVQPAERLLSVIRKFRCWNESAFLICGHCVPLYYWASHSVFLVPVWSFWSQTCLACSSLSCFYLTCRLYTNLGFFLLLWSLFSQHNYFRCLDLLCNSKPVFPTTFHFLSNYCPFFVFLNLTIQSNGSTFLLLSRLLYSSLPVTSQCSLPLSSVYFSWFFFLRS